MANQYTDSWPSLRAKIEHYLDTTSHPNGCWIWTRSKTARGYGEVAWKGKVYRVHRVYLKELGIDVPDGMDVDHLCRVHDCANPEHLEVVTHQENIRRGETGKWERVLPTHCANGHPWEETKRLTNKGHRECRECHKASNAERVPCEVCGKEVSRSNRAAHRRAMHEGRTI